VKNTQVSIPVKRATHYYLKVAIDIYSILTIFLNA